MSEQDPKSPVRAITITVACASLSGAAFVSHWLGVLRMPFFVTFISLPAALALVGIYLWHKRLPDRWLAQRIWAGCWIGLLATFCVPKFQIRIRLKPDAVLNVA